MQPALAAIWLSVALGAALGIGQRWAPRVTDPIRTFAVVAAALVVSLSLLPHALACEGMAGLLGATLGYAAIPALERVGMALFRRADPDAMRLELGYSGLLLHRFGDGVAMSVDGHGYGVLWALGAHEIPIVALVTLAFARRGAGVALARAAALGLSSSLGYWLVSALPAATWHELHGWADAIAAGVLVHIVAHEGLSAREQRGGAPALVPPTQPSRAQRALNLAAGLAACLLIVSLGHDEGPGATNLLEGLLQLALELAPWLCIGAVARAGLELRAHRVGVAGAASVGAASVGAASVAAADAPPALAGGRWWSALQRIVVQYAGWVLLGLLAASYAAAFTDGALAPTRVGWSLIAAVLAVACPPAAAPLAAVLANQGLPFAAALVLLLVGPLAKSLGRSTASGARLHAGRATFGAVLLAIVVLWDRSATPARVSALLPVGAQWLLLLASCVCLSHGLWQNGLRGWLQASLPAPDAAPRAAAAHAHAWHGHG